MESLLSYVTPYVFGCPEMVAEQKILEAAIKVCEDSNCWRKKQTSTVDAVTDPDVTESSVTLTFDTGAELITVPVCTRDSLPYMDYELSGNNIVVPAWGQDSTLVATISQRPLTTVESLPTAFKAIKYTKWREATAELSKALLHSMQGMPWFDPRLAAMELTSYNQYIGMLRRQVIQPNGMTEIRITARPFV